MRIPLSEISDRRMEEWRELYQASSHGQVFQHPAWAEGCLKVFPEEARQASVYAVTRQGSLSTLGAFRFSREGMPGLTGLANLNLRLRVGRFLLHELADYNGFLSDQARSGADILDILDESRSTEKWDVLKLKDISSRDPALASLQLMREKGYSFTLTKGNFCPYVPLEGSFEEYLDRQLGPPSHTLRRMFRKVLKLDSLEFVEEGQVPAGQFRIDELVEIESQSWKSKTGLFATPQKRRFYQHVLSRLHAEGRLQYLLCRAFGQPKAYALGFYSGNRWLFYSTAYKPEESNRYSFGKTVMLLTLKKMFDLKLDEADFMRGTELSKLVVTGAARQNYDLYLFASASAKAAFDAALFLRRKVKQALGKTPQTWPGVVEESAFAAGQPAFRR